MNPPLPSYRLRAVHLTAVWAYAVSQPIFSMLDANPEFVLVRGATRLETIMFAGALVVAVPLAVVICEWIVSRFSRRASDVLHVIFLGAFTLPLVLQLLKRFDPGKSGAVIAGVLVTVGAVAAYMRWTSVRTFLSVSVVLPAVGLVLFVTGIPVVVDDAAGAELGARPRVPVVLVVFDEFPVSSLMTAEGELDEARYPNFARLAHSATWYPRATTVHNHTAGAVPAILSGNLPSPGELPTLAVHPKNLFTLLGEAYTLNAHEVMTYLCPQRYCPRDRGPAHQRLLALVSDVRVAYLHRVLPESLAAGLPAVGDRWSGLARERVRAMSEVRFRDVFADATETGAHEFETFLSEFTRAEAPSTLHFVHVLLPHNPWRRLPSGRTYEASFELEGVRESGRWVEDHWQVWQGYQRHLLQVGYTDTVVGRLLDRLQSRGLYDRALVIVVADHGISFLPGQPRRGTNKRNFADIARVPLFIKLPGQRDGQTALHPARTIDILPTIADVLGVRVPWAIDGRSLLGSPVAGTDVVVVQHDGTNARASIEVLDRGMSEALRRKTAVFGEGADSLYAVGTNVRLLGEASGRNGLVSKTVRAELENEAQFDDVRISSAFLPVRITGTIHGAAVSRKVEFAVAVNGRIVALTRWYLDDGVRRFSALVPESALRDGFNRVEIFAIGRGASRLTRLGANVERHGDRSAEARTPD